jgi:hypothetical protein
MNASGGSAYIGRAFIGLEMGRNAAKEAFDQNLYLGPAPVSLP